MRAKPKKSVFGFLRKSADSPTPSDGPHRGKMWSGCLESWRLPGIITVLEFFAAAGSRERARHRNLPPPPPVRDFRVVVDVLCSGCWPAWLDTSPTLRRV